MVSYLYDYENGAKKNNVGYVKIEVRNGQCKTTIHLKCLSLSGKSLIAYLFLRKENRMIGIFLGKVFLQGGTGDTRVIVPAERMGKSPYSINDMGGLVLLEEGRFSDSQNGTLRESPGKFLGTEWDDNPIRMDNFCVWNETMEKKQMETSSSEIEVIMPKSKYPDMREIINHTEKVQLLNSERERHRKQNVARERQEIFNAERPLGETIEDKAQTETSPLDRWTEEVLRPGVKEETIVQAAEWKEEGLSKEKSAEAGASKEEDFIIEENNVPKEKETAEDSIQKKDEAIIKEEKVIKEESALKEDAEKKRDDSAKEQSDQEKVSVSEKSSEKQDSLAAQIFANYPHMFPFEDDEVAECVRMEPQDIGVFPIEVWALANNSFLLHGYYSYRHLIFARKNGENGEEYILGIPGIYHNREKFMAKMFGFEAFKPIKKDQQKTGEFGYWYRKIMVG